MATVISNMTSEDLLVAAPFIPAGSSGMIRLLELPPGDPGIGPHRHSGPVSTTLSLTTKPQLVQ